MLKTLSGRTPSQVEYEIKSLIGLMKTRKVRSYLEVGARHGDTFYDVMKSLPRGSIGVAVDLPGGAWGNVKSMKALNKACEFLRADGYQIKRIFADSQQAATRDSVIKAMRKYHLEFFDAVLIDADHRYEGVKRDWELYGELGRLIAFHDIAGVGVTTNTDERLPVEVPRLWGEIKQGREYVEYIGEGSLMGIGAILK